MSYTSIEASVDQGEPFFLYAFTVQEAASTEVTTRFTSDPEDLTEMDVLWTRSPIRHSNLEQNGNIEKASVDFIFPVSNTFARTFLEPGARYITTITVWRGHHTDVTNTPQVVWKGRVIDAKSSNQSITIVGESVFTSMRRMGLRAKYQRTCIHTLYRPGCNLDRADFEIAATVTAVSSSELVLTVTEASGQADGFYKAGIVDWNGLLGFIQNHTGTALTLLSKIPGLAEEVIANGPTLVMLAPGCDLGKLTCLNKFNNVLNFGGFPYFPEKNPFEQSIV